MTKSSRALVAVAIAIPFVTACPYHGAVPIGKADPAAFDVSLIGEWKTGKETGVHGGRVWIARYDEDEYAVIGMGDCPDPAGRAYLTKIAGKTFINIREAGDAGRYRIARLDREGNAITLRHLSGTLDSVASSMQLEEIITARIEDPKLYEEETRLTKTGIARDETGEAAMALAPRACEYDGDVGLGEAAAVPEIASMTGTWQLNEGGDTTTFEISRSGAKELILNLGPLFMSDGDVKMNAYFTRIDGRTFINVYQKTGSDRHNTIARLDVVSDTVFLRLLNRTVYAKTPADLRKAVSGHTDDPAIYYWDTTSLVRVKK